MRDSSILVATLSLFAVISIAVITHNPWCFLGLVSWTFGVIAVWLEDNKS